MDTTYAIFLGKNRLSLVNLVAMEEVAFLPVESQPIPFSNADRHDDTIRSILFFRKNGLRQVEFSFPEGKPKMAIHPPLDGRRVSVIPGFLLGDLLWIGNGKIAWLVDGPQRILRIGSIQEGRFRFLESSHPGPPGQLFGLVNGFPALLSEDKHQILLLETDRN